MELSCTLLYCFANEVDKLIKSFEWFESDMRNYHITTDRRNKYQESVQECRNLCYSYAYHLEYFEIVDYLNSLPYYSPSCVYVDPIIICCVKNKIDSVKRFISLLYIKENIYHSELLRMYIHVACYCNHIDLMKYLISNYIDKEGKNKYKLSKLYASSMTEFSDDVNEMDPYWINDIVIASLNNNFNKVKILLELYYDEDGIFDGHIEHMSENVSSYLSDVIEYAAKYNNIEMVKYIFNLVETNKHITRKTYLINFSNSIVEAINNNNAKILKFLLTKYEKSLEIIKHIHLKPNVIMMIHIIKSLKLSMYELYDFYRARQFDDIHIIKYFVLLGVEMYNPYALKIKSQLI